MRRLLLLRLLLVGAEGIWAEETEEQPPPDEAAVARSLSVAEGHITAGRWAEALESYQGVLTTADVSRPEAWVGAALCFRESSRPAETITALKAGINSSTQRSEQEFSRLMPAVLVGRGLRRPGAGHGATAEGDDAEAKAWLSQGDELRATNQLELAAAAYRRSVSVAGPTSTQSDAWNRLGLALMLMGSTRDAKQALEQSVCFRPFNAEGWVNYAIALKNLGGQESLAAALAALETSLKLVSGFPRALMVAASVLQLLGQDDRAIRLYQSVLLETKEAAPADLPIAQRVEGWVNLGVLLRAKGPTFSEAALQCYRQAVVLQPEAAAANYNLGIALQEQGMLEEAAAAFGRALQAPVGGGSGWGTRGRVDAYVNMGVSLQYQGRVADAANLYRAAFNESNSTDIDAVLNLGNALSILGEVEEAVQAFLWTVRLNPFHLEAWILGLNLFVQKGNLPEAERTFGLILNSIPEEVPRPAVLVNMYAYILLNSGEGHCERVSPLLSGMALRQGDEAELVKQTLHSSI
jgi:tetratricopeptide (TPR) repeat protein